MDGNGVLPGIHFSSCRDFQNAFSSRGKGALVKFPAAVVRLFEQSDPELVKFPAAVVRLFEQSDPEGQTMSNTHPENGPARID